MDLPSLRRRLEGEYGLQLSSITDEQLARVVAQAGAAAPLPKIADHLPISESSLLRDPEVWEWLSERLRLELPLCVQRGAPLRVLSLGCSEGQEVFSLAITALEAAREAQLSAALGRRMIQIDGIDISASRIERARTGVMADWSIRREPPPHFAAHLHRKGGEWRVSETVRALCHFEVGNLLALSADRLSQYDFVLCRHVLIYFSPARARQVAAVLAASLAPAATLMLAPVEAHLLDGVLGLSPVGPVGTARKGEPPSRPAVTAQARRPAPPVAAPPAAPASPPQGDAETHRARAVKAGESGRLHEALSLARAAAFMDPDHLGGRLLLAQFQLQLEPELGRRMLRALLEDARTRSNSADPELSLQQLVMAAERLLSNG